MPARRIFSTLSLLLGIALVLAACGPDSNETTPTAAPATTEAAPMPTSAPMSTTAPQSGPSGRNGAAAPQGPHGKDGADGVSGPRGSSGATLAPAATVAPTPRTMREPTAQAMMPKPTAMAAPTATPAAMMMQPTAAAMATAAPQAAVSSGTQGGSGTRGAQGSPGATTFQDYPRSPAVATAEDSMSTFSLDTDRTSYYLALNWAQSGFEIDPASVRAEEWVNSFDYAYAPPSSEDRFAISTDIFRHPLDGGKRLARLAFQAPDLHGGERALNVTLVLDASGSMGDGNRVAIAREAAESIRRSLRSHDRISVVHFTTNVIHEYTVGPLRPDDRDVK